MFNEAVLYALSSLMLIGRLNCTALSPVMQIFVAMLLSVNALIFTFLGTNASILYFQKQYKIH